MFLFSSFNLSYELQFNVGYSFIALILVMLALNLGVMIYKTVEKYKLKKRRKALEKHKDEIHKNYAKSFHEALESEIRKQKLKLMKKGNDESVSSSSEEDSSEDSYDASKRIRAGKEKLKSVEQFKKRRHLSRSIKK